MNYNLQRFVYAQQEYYDIALSEIKQGQKQSHWIWFIFPQMIGLGHSSYANYYGIKDIEEAKAYLNHELLGKHLREITKALLDINSDNIDKIMGWPDNLKLKSSMTLFAIVSDGDIFQEILDKYYHGKRCEKTLKLLDR